jgi:ankyrin repeat protein
MTTIDNSPLINLIYYKSDDKNIIKILSEFPEEARKKTKYGNLPLHDVCSRRFSIEIIKELLSLYPEAIYEKDNDGNIPLSLAIIWDCNEDVILELISRCYKTAIIKNNYNRLPIYNAIKYGKISFKIIKILLDSYPDAVYDKDENDNILLQFAIKSKASFEIIKTIYSLYPEALFCKNKFGELSIHNAIYNKMSEFIIMLLSSYPDMAREKNIHCDYPLQIAIRNELCDEAILKILYSYPDIVHNKDIGTGHELLRLAVRLRTSSEIISALLTLYPKGSHSSNNEKCSLLEFAIYNCRITYDVNTISVIAKSYPKAVYTRGYDLITTLLFYNAYFELIMVLLSIYPAVARKKNKYGELLLHHVISNYSNSYEYKIIIELLSIYPEGINKRNKDGNTVLHLACINFNIENVKLLLAYGADYNIVNNNEQTALSITQSWNNIEFINIIDRWPVIMFIIVLEKLLIYPSLDLQDIEDMYQFIN